MRCSLFARPRSPTRSFPCGARVRFRGMRDVAVAVIMVVMSSGVARAAEIEVRLKLDVEAAQVRAELSGIGPMPLDQFELRSPLDGTTARATKIEPVSEPIAIALVYSGWELWIGDNELDVTPPRYAGALKQLAAALDEAPFARIAPPGSEIVAIEYSSGARVVAKLGELDAFRGAALGMQASYRDRIGNDLGDGIALAIEELGKAKAERRAIVVLGDGGDTDEGTARERLRLLRERAQLARIAMREAIVLRSSISSSAVVVGAFADAPIDIRAAGELRAALQRVAKRLEDRRVAVTFDASKLTIDPDRDEVLVVIGTETIATRFGYGNPPEPPEGRWSRWCLALVGGCLVLLVGVGVRRRSRRGTT